MWSYATVAQGGSLPPILWTLAYASVAQGRQLSHTKLRTRFRVGLVGPLHTGADSRARGVSASCKRKAQTYQTQAGSVASGPGSGPVGVLLRWDPPGSGLLVVAGGAAGFGPSGVAAGGVAPLVSS